MNWNKTQMVTTGVQPMNKRNLSLGHAMSYFVLVVALLGAPMAFADPQGWTCEAGLCTSDSEIAIAQHSGVFDHGANISRSMQADRLAELEQQRWREYKYTVMAPLRVYARGTVDRDYAPADWPGDISLGNVGLDVSLHYSSDGQSYSKVDNGAVLPVGALLSVVVGQDTWGVGSSYATYYPTSWVLDVTARAVIEETSLNAGNPALPSALLQADNADSVDAPADDPALDDTAQLIEPFDPECGEMAECKPEPDPVDVIADDPAPVNEDEPVAMGDPLAVDLQMELTRVGCYLAEVDGLWGPASRRAMTNFNRWTGGDWVVDYPTGEALLAVLSTAGAVCGVD